MLEELNCQTVFTIPVFGGIAVDESIVVTWIIMAVLAVLSIVFVRNLKVENPGKVQLALESVISWAQDFFEGIIGRENRRYIPYLMTVALYLAVSNVIEMCIRDRGIRLRGIQITDSARGLPGGLQRISRFRRWYI